MKACVRLDSQENQKEDFSLEGLNGLRGWAHWRREEMNLEKFIYLSGRTGKRGLKEGVELAEEAAVGTGNAYPTPSACSLSPKLSWNTI